MKDSLYTRRDTLRLQGFDYAARRIYFVTIAAAERRRVFLNGSLASATIDCLIELHRKYGFNLYVYCLMPDHLHALIGIGASQLTLGAICGAFKSLSTRAFWQYGTGRLWQRQFFDHIVRNEEDFLETLEYIKLNPVRRGLVKAWEEWPYTGRVDFLK